MENTSFNLELVLVFPSLITRHGKIISYNQFMTLSDDFKIRVHLTKPFFAFQSKTYKNESGQNNGCLFSYSGTNFQKLDPFLCCYSQQCFSKLEKRRFSVKGNFFGSFKKFPLKPCSHIPLCLVFSTSVSYISSFSQFPLNSSFVWRKCFIYSFLFKKWEQLCSFNSTIVSWIKICLCLCC